MDNFDTSFIGNDTFENEDQIDFNIDDEINQLLRDNGQSRLGKDNNEIVTVSRNILCSCDG